MDGDISYLTVAPFYDIPLTFEVTFKQVVKQTSPIVWFHLPT